MPTDTGLSNGDTCWTPGYPWPQIYHLKGCLHGCNVLNKKICMCSFLQGSKVLQRSSNWASWIPSFYKMLFPDSTWIRTWSSSLTFLSQPLIKRKCCIPWMPMVSGQDRPFQETWGPLLVLLRPKEKTKPSLPCHPDSGLQLLLNSTISSPQVSS